NMAHAERSPPRRRRVRLALRLRPLGLAFGASGIDRTAPRTIADDLSYVLHKHALWITLYATAQYTECHWQPDAHFCGFRCGQLRAPGKPSDQEDSLSCSAAADLSGDVLD